MAAPTLVACAMATGTGTTHATASVSWNSGDVVTAIVITEGQGAETTHIPTTAGSGVSLSTVASHVSSGTNCGIYAFQCTTTATSSGTFSATNPNNGTPSTTNFVLGVYIHRGSAGGGNTAVTSSPSSTRTLSLTPTAADSSIVWGVGDWNADAVQTVTPTPTTHSSASPGPTATPESLLVSTKYTQYVNELDDQTSTGATSYGLGGTTTGPFTIVVVEIKASGGATPVIPNVFMAPMIGA